MRRGGSTRMCFSDKTVSRSLMNRVPTKSFDLCPLQSLVSGWGGQYSFRCQPVDYSQNPLAVRMAHGCWWYYFSKFTEFMDTIFFVLRKKNDHISTLHVIHHGCMPMSVWFGVKFTPGKRSPLSSSNIPCLHLCRRLI